MSSGGWRYAVASVAGTSHERADLPCQDASTCLVLTTNDGDPVLLAVVSDGAGSASKAEVGSALACSAMAASAAAFLRDGGRMADIDRQVVLDWVARFRQEVVTCAEAEGLTPRDYACTLLVAIIGIESAAFAQVGDGSIVVSRRAEPGEYAWVFWPQEGEYANVTWFATDEAVGDRLEYDLVVGSVDEVAMFTDGMQRLALNYAARTAHAPFFRPMFAALRDAPEGTADGLSGALANFLRSRPVSQRTDDDKTLILATRADRSGFPSAAEDIGAEPSHE